MKLLRNEKGITLIELLAAIVIVGFLAVLIWRFFFQTIDYNSYAVTEQILQQEANVILATLQAEHNRSTIFSLSGGDSLTAKIYNAEGTAIKQDPIVISDRPNITYTLLAAYPPDPTDPTSGSTSKPTIQSTKNTIANRQELEIHLVLSSTYKEGIPLTFLLSTRLSKLTAN